MSNKVFSEIKQNLKQLYLEDPRPSAVESFWVNVIGRGYPPPNRVFRWCTSRLKIDPMSTFALIT
jgi:3'-phosphoadenosine 5'-phosphosulfate sulfotransferase (PAPS reductase)/FAD synthetase